MRPLLLHVDNFGSFREPVTVDFSDVDYFVLVGPTGAGKSTLIDAICFALYGTVPRWDDKKVISHALAPSAIAGKVALVFESSGRRHAVVRALKRDPKGKVHTSEARLDELDPDLPPSAGLEELMGAILGPVAEGAAVTTEVQRITGLEYRFFTQCVVLPQGKFAEFLHTEPGKRQDLLVQLLGADVYERVRQRAVQEENAAAQAASFARGRLARLTDADEAAEQAAAARLDSLRALGDQVRTDLDALSASDAERRALSEERDDLRRRLAALTALAMPPEVPDLAETARQAAKEVTGHTSAAADAEAAEQRAEDELAALDDPDVLTDELRKIEEHQRLVTELRAASDSAARTRAELEPLAARSRTLQAELAEAEQARDRLRDAHLGAELARRLVVGHDCPTCLRPVEHLPHHPETAGLRAAERRVAACEQEAEQARTRHTRAETEARHLERTAHDLSTRASAVPLPAALRAEVEERLAVVREAHRRAARLRKAGRDARAGLAGARSRADELTGRTDRLWRDLETARDTVVPLGAPPLDRGDLHHAWTSLLTWREEAATGQRLALETQDGRIAGAERRAGRLWSAVVARLAEHDVPVPADAAAGPGGHDAPDAAAARLGELVVVAIARARERLNRVKENRATARELDEQARTEEERARVAKELAQCLRADAFERWLCTEALDLLVTAASETLRELSDDQYELALGPRNEIEVIDHAEAGMRRNARTLSGGETFQAALALALALSDQVAGLSTAAARSLDSLFLDEGFGSLDPATLDTVATTLERLAGGRERMVGVVTHVPALADRVPVRFEVHRDAKGSHLCRTT
ncbi:AAA family ATPase [Nonomuraea insulae]|uniref:Nuclease SbcCD subunit C n=1 Tax=Nonomuraea insulae TaxID=1616787 RepID=A0ABW1DC13_9ACTN